MPSSTPPRQPNRTKTIEIPTSVNEALAELHELRRSLNRIEESLDAHSDDLPWRDRATKARGYIQRRISFLIAWLLKGEGDDRLLAAALVITERLHEDMEGGLEGDELRVLHRLRSRFPVAHHA